MDEALLARGTKLAPDARRAVPNVWSQMSRVSARLRTRLRTVADVLVGAMLGMIPALLPAGAFVALAGVSNESESFMIAMLYAGSVGGCAVGIAFGRRGAAKSCAAQH